MAEAEYYWVKENSSKFCSWHLILILRLFQDTGTYLHARSKVGRKERIQNK